MVTQASINDAVTVFAVGIGFALIVGVMGGMLFSLFRTLRSVLGLD